MSWLEKIPIQKRTLELCVIASEQDEEAAWEFIPENMRIEVSYTNIENLYENNENNEDEVYIVVEYDNHDYSDRISGFDPTEKKFIFDNLEGAIEFATACSKQYKYNRKHPLMETECPKWLNRIKCWSNDNGDIVYILAKKCYKSLSMEEYLKI